MEKLQKSKITIFGDSIPKGIISEDGQIKTLDDSAVTIIAKECNLDITNLSSYGLTLSKVINRNYIDNYIDNIDRTCDNIAVISLGGNDSDYDWCNVAKTPNDWHDPKTTPDSFREGLVNIIKKLQSNGVRVVISNIVPVNSARYYNNVIGKIADKDKVLEFLKGDIDNIYRHQELYNLIITDCARDNNCRILDIREAFLYSNDYLDYLCQDGIHPNKLGHKKIAESVIKQLKNNVNYVI